MRVLLTGATGFLGSHLAHLFVDRGISLSVLKRPSSDLERIKKIIGHLDLHDVDGRGIEKALDSHGELDAVVHTATCYGRRGEKRDSIFDCNLYFPLRLLEAAAEREVSLFINTDTFFPRGYHPMGDYVTSKKDFVDRGRALAASRGVGFINMMLQHMYGPGDQPDKFIPWLIQACLDNLSEVDLTEGSQRRDFIYVDDVSSAFVAVLEGLQAGDTSFAEFEVGTGISTTIRDLAKLIHRTTGSSTEMRFGALPLNTHEIMDAVADPSALSQLGWKAEVGLEEGIDRTVRSMRVR